MRAIVKASDAAGSLDVVDMPVPTPGADEVLVQIKAASICYSDVSILNNHYVGRKPVPVPLIMGHEGAGVVSARGVGVKGLAVGDRVALEPISGCGCCSMCESGSKNMCSNWEHLGITRHGVFAEYVAVRAEQAHKIPDTVSFPEAALLEPLGLAVRSLEQSKPMLGESVAILGPGSLGMMHLLAYRASGGSKIIMLGLEKDQTRLEMARQLGADCTINISDTDPVEAIREVTGSLGADIVVETANSPKAAQMCFDLAAPRGRIVLFGLYPEAIFSPLKLLRNALTVYGDVGALPRQFLRAINWLQSGKVSAKNLITKRFALEDAREAFAAAAEGNSIKIVFEL